MTKVDFEFALLDSVRIVPIGISGVVDSLCIDSAGTQYRVAYWYNGERKTTWMYADEIAKESKQ